MQKSYDNSPTLYLVPTPIGNLTDITKRALDILKSVDFVLCEDTRVTNSLLRNYEVHNNLFSCHEFNEDNIKNLVLDKLKQGKNIALVTDQGSPIVSDPGYIVAQYIIKNGFNVVGLPGATAFVPAIMMSGISANHFLFYGFLNTKKGKMMQELESMKKYPFPIVFYEAPHRVLKTLDTMLEIFGDRYVAISREISKIHEEVVRGKITECIKEMEFIKGEYVIVVSGCDREKYDNLTIYEHINLYLDDGISEMEAIKKVAKERNIAKSIIYKEYLKAKEE